VDPSTTAGGDECGIVAAGVGMCACKGELEQHGFVLEDATVQGSPQLWAQRAVRVYDKWEADKMVAESNQGGEMVSLTIWTVPGAPPVSLIHASRGKFVRAEPVSSLYELSKVHHVGRFEDLEDELTQWQQGAQSPNRLDALVYALTELMLDSEPKHTWDWA
jgi:phage terminase large subunit-like protein